MSLTALLTRQPERCIFVFAPSSVCRSSTDAIGKATNAELNIPGGLPSVDAAHICPSTYLLGSLNHLWWSAASATATVSCSTKDANDNLVDRTFSAGSAAQHKWLVPPPQLTGAVLRHPQDG